MFTSGDSTWEGGGGSCVACAFFPGRFRVADYINPLSLGCHDNCFYTFYNDKSDDCCYNNDDYCYGSGSFRFGEFGLGVCVRFAGIGAVEVLASRGSAGAV